MKKKNIVIKMRLPCMNKSLKNMAFKVRQSKLLYVFLDFSYKFLVW